MGVGSDFDVHGVSLVEIFLFHAAYADCLLPEPHIGAVRVDFRVGCADHVELAFSFAEFLELLDIALVGVLFIDLLFFPLLENFVEKVLLDCLQVLLDLYCVPIN